jgi:hypothetical protein
MKYISIEEAMATSLLFIWENYPQNVGKYVLDLEEDHAEYGHGVVILFNDGYYTVYYKFDTSEEVTLGETSDPARALNLANQYLDSL